MDILALLFSPDSVAWSVFVIMVVAAAGLAIGNIRLFGINLGIAGVLFSGIALGHFGLAINHGTLEFLRDFGLILFVYSVGTQVGPGFFSSFKKQGLQLNLLAVAVVLGGVGMALLAGRLGGFDIPTVVGMYSGAVTNTPSLAAAQQSLAAANPELVNSSSVGYALAYPGAILGIIGTMLLIRRLFRREIEEDMKAAPARQASDFITASVTVENRNLEGLAVKDIPALAEMGVVVSRVLHAGALAVAHEDTVLHLGDTVLAVGSEESVRKFIVVVGSRSSLDLKQMPSRIIHSRVVVTRKEVLGRTIKELGLETKYDVAATRVARADVEFLISDSYALQYADNLVLVGDEAAVAQAGAQLGNSPKDLNHPQLIPAFIGIAAGVVLGSIPFSIPGLSAPVRLGLAGGPLIIAIALSYIQRIGPLSWYLPPAGNLMLRELGIVLFLSCVGLKAGGRFFETLLSGSGLAIVLYSFLISVVPLLLVGLYAKIKLKVNYLSLCGALAGSMTDPPALAFANAMAPSNHSAMSYASVYPLVMILRIISAQLLVLLFL